MLYGPPPPPFLEKFCVKPCTSAVDTKKVLRTEGEGLEQEESTGSLIHQRRADFNELGQWPEAASDLGYNYLVTCTFQNLYSLMKDYWSEIFELLMNLTT